jgi:hypothetical protein
MSTEGDGKREGHRRCEYCAECTRQYVGCTYAVDELSDSEVSARSILTLNGSKALSQLLQESRGRIENNALEACRAHLSLCWCQTSCQPLRLFLTPSKVSRDTQSTWQVLSLIPCSHLTSSNYATTPEACASDGLYTHLSFAAVTMEELWRVWLRSSMGMQAIAAIHLVQLTAVRPRFDLTHSRGLNETLVGWPKHKHLVHNRRECHYSVFVQMDMRDFLYFRPRRPRVPWRPTGRCPTAPILFDLRVSTHDEGLHLCTTNDSEDYDTMIQMSATHGWRTMPHMGRSALHRRRSWKEDKTSRLALPSEGDVLDRFAYGNTFSATRMDHL